MLKAGTAARRRSLRFDRRLPAEEVRHGIEQFLKQFDAKLQERDASWVGHCKLLINAGERTAYASLTAAGDTPRWAGQPPEVDVAEITIYVALYGWVDGDVAQALDDLLAAYPLLPDAQPATR